MSQLGVQVSVLLLLIVDLRPELRLEDSRLDQVVLKSGDLSLGVLRLFDVFCEFRLCLRCFRHRIGHLQPALGLDCTDLLLDFSHLGLESGSFRRSLLLDVEKLRPELGLRCLGPGDDISHGAFLLVRELGPEPRLSSCRLGLGLRQLSPPLILRRLELVLGELQLGMEPVFGGTKAGLEISLRRSVLGREFLQLRGVLLLIRLSLHRRLLELKLKVDLGRG